MQVFNSFQEMTGTGDSVQSTMDVFNMEQAVANNIFDFASNPDNTVTPGGVKPVLPAQQTGDRNAIPEWGQTLTGRVDKLENEVRQVNGKVDEILRRLPQ